MRIRAVLMRIRAVLTRIRAVLTLLQGIWSELKDLLITFLTGCVVGVICSFLGSPAELNWPTAEMSGRGNAQPHRTANPNPTALYRTVNPNPTAL